MLKPFWLRGIGIVVSLGTVGCAELVGADFDDPHARQSVAPNAPPPPFKYYLKAAEPQPGAQFGYQLAMDDTGLLVTAAFENEGLLAQTGAAYFFDLTKMPAQAPTRIVTPYARAMDGLIPERLIPEFVPTLGALYGALSPEFVVIGVPSESSALTEEPPDEGAPASGAVYVYERAHLDAPVQYIKAPHIQADALFGESLALSGSLLAISAPTEANPGAPQSGAVYVYEQRGSRFEFSARLRPEIAHDGDWFGNSLALEGDLLVVGAPFERSKSTGIDNDPNDASVTAAGAAYVYHRSSFGEWQLEAYVKPSQSVALGAFGANVAVSKGRIAVGAPGAAGACLDGTAFGGGAAYVFSQTNGAWSLEHCFSPRSGTAPVLFGYDLALYDSRLLVGAPWDPSGRADDPTDTTRSFSGAAYVFDRDERGAWNESAYLKAPNAGDDDNFGFSVDLAPGKVVVAAPQESGGGWGPNADPFDDIVPHSGAAYLYSE